MLICKYLHLIYFKYPYYCFLKDKQPTEATAAKGIITILKVKQGYTSKGCGEMGFNSQKVR